jgi:CheY-like chemotaxis protein
MENEVNPTEFPDCLPLLTDSKILVVEDDPLVCESIRALLGWHGFAVRTSESLLDALNALQIVDYDLVLLDLMLDDQCGFAVMDHLAERNLDTQVIVVTGQHSERYAITALKKGASDYLKKPFEPDDLLSSVNKGLSQQKSQREMSLFKRLVGSSSVAIAIADASGRIVYTNAAYRRLIDPNDVVAKHSPATHGHLADGERHIDVQIRKSIAVGTPWEGSVALVDANGRRFMAWKRVDPIPETIGGVAYGVAMVQEKVHHPGHEPVKNGLQTESEKLKEVLAEIKHLRGTLAICSSCKKVRGEEGRWDEIEAYIESHTNARFSHSLCPQCARRLYPELYP